MRLKILTCFAFILLVQQGISQVTIRGRVIGSDDGLPIPGVAVVSKGVEHTHPTDINGQFEFIIELGRTLVFIFPGYEKQSIIVEEDKFYEIALVPECISDHFDSSLFYLNTGVELANSQLGFSVDYTSRFSLPIDFKASASYYWNSQSSNLNTNLSILDIVHSCEFELEANFRYQSVDMESYKFQNSTASIELRSDLWTPSIGFGINQFRNEGSLSNNAGILVGLKREIFIGRKYIPVSLSTTFWQNKPEVNISAEYYFFRNIRLKVGYQGYGDFNSIIGSLGILIRTWKKTY